MAYFSNEKSDTLISGTSSTDEIENWGENVTINGYDGDNIIVNFAEGVNVSISCGNGNDYIDNYAKNVTISGGGGNDYIENHYGSNIVFNYTSGDGNDIIEGFRADSTLSIGGDSYSSETIGDDVIVTVGDDKISLIGAASLESVNIDGTLDTVNTAILVLTDGNDTLKNTSDGAIIAALGGNDSIRIYGDGVSIDAGAGNDSIRNYGDNVTISGGTGNDTLRNAFGENVLFDYSTGDGSDVIIGFNETSTLQIGGGTGTYSTTKSGNNIIVTAGSGNVTLAGAAKLDTLNILGTEKTYKTLTLTEKSSAKITLPATYIATNGISRTTAINITGNALDNTISGGAGADTLSGGAGNDSILGGAGNDNLNGGSGDDILLGSDGNDKLYGYTGDDTLIGGAGNDSLWGQAGADTFIYADGDGKDKIYNFDDDDMLQISGDWTAAYYSGSGRVVFKVGSTYSAIILENSTAATFNINGETYAVSNNQFTKQ